MTSGGPDRRRCSFCLPKLMEEHAFYLFRRALQKSYF
ncbi:unnamed protein product [Acanthoscelides obtectus]|uniref:Uncharacterized protein n=1 Tax=Acanthoscelides obtectus TaxID=200917 RepID=A0A9P0LHJ0_ACAOB|nr:unnamed protein product [Acanthoscelides obtectus]CAK1632263.1 hypothetical protein AOBTE_LOCUS7448 [Acanthoscelides obtectus]